MNISELKHEMEFYRRNRPHSKAPIPHDLCQHIKEFERTSTMSRKEIMNELSLASKQIIRICGRVDKKKKASVNREALPRPGRVKHSGVDKTGKAAATASTESGFVVTTPNGYRVEGLTLSQLERLTK